MAVFNSQRTYGVEIEFHSSMRANEIALAINDGFLTDGINNTCHGERYNHNATRNWKIVYDGSVMRGWELVSPPLSGQEGFEEIRSAVKTLVELGCSVSTQTGLHVHHDGQNLSGKAIGQVFGIYASYQTLIDYMVSPSRRSTVGYAKRLNWGRITKNGTEKFSKDDRKEAITKIRREHGCRHDNSCRCGARYHAVNILSILQHGTIEFRQHQGSLNATRIINWILLTQSIIEASRERRSIPKPANVDGLKDTNGVFYRFRKSIKIYAPWNEGATTEDCQPYIDAFAYWNKRIKKFSKADGININEVASI